jgi:hypothetical protein
MFNKKKKIESVLRDLHLDDEFTKMIGVLADAHNRSDRAIINAYTDVRKKLELYALRSAEHEYFVAKGHLVESLSKLKTDMRFCTEVSEEFLNHPDKKMIIIKMQENCVEQIVQEAVSAISSPSREERLKQCIRKELCNF